MEMWKSVEYLGRNRSTRMGVVGLLVVVVYLNIFRNGFFGDDFLFNYHWEAVRSVGGLVEIARGNLPVFIEGTYKPVMGFWYWFLYQMAGDEIWAYHLWSLGWHLLGTWLVMWLVEELIQSKVAGLISGLVFGLHPIHVEAVTYISASFDTAGMVIGIASVCLFVRAVGCKRENDARLWLRYSWLMAGVAVFNHEINLMVGMVIIWLWWVLRPRKLSLWSVAKGYVVVNVAYISIRYWLVGISSRGEHVGGEFGKTMMVSLKALVRYVELLVWPTKMRLLHELPGEIRVSEIPSLVQTAMLRQNWSDAAVVWGVGVFLVWIGLIWVGRKKWPLGSWGLGYILLGLLPVMNLVPGASFVSERYAYFASVGFAILVGIGAKFLEKRKCRYQVIVLMILVGLVLGGYGRIVEFRNRDWKSELSMWRVSVEQDPNNMWARFKLGEAYQQEGRMEWAITQYDRVFETVPRFGLVNLRLGLLYLDIGEEELGQEYLRRAQESECCAQTATDLLKNLN